MNKFLGIIAVSVAALLFSTCLALATPVTTTTTVAAGSGTDGYWSEEEFSSTTWGDYDPSLNGQSFDWNTHAAAGDWIHGDESFSLDLNAMIDNIVSANFSLILGGAGYLNPATVALNGFNLGEASVGDGSMIGANRYMLDMWPLSYDVMNSISLSNTLNISSLMGDGWAFLGAEFSGTQMIWNEGTGIDPGTAPVPEPATMLLFGTGLVGLVGARARARKKTKKEA